MRYLFAFLCPPLAILLCGKPILAFLSIFLWIAGYFPGALLALLIVSSTKATERTALLMANADRNARAVIKSSERQTKQVVGAMKAATIPAVAMAPAPVRALPAAPKEPLVTVEGIHIAILDAKDGAIYAYRNLPEWAQPVLWGFAAATPFSMALTIYMLRR